MTTGVQGAMPRSAAAVGDRPRDADRLTPLAKRERFTGAMAKAISWPGWKTIGAAAPSVVAIGTVVVAALTFFVSQQTLQANTRQQASDRFGKAIEHLGSNNPDVRLGGIYELDKLATDTPSEQVDVFNVLTSFVRGHAVVGKDKCADSSPPGVVPGSSTPTTAAATAMALRTAPALAPVASSPDSIGPRPDEDVQTVIHLVGQRDRKYDNKNKPVDLSHSCLRGASFLEQSVADYSDVSMNSSDLRSANLGLTKLENAYFLGATLDDALIIGARLDNARLTYAHMWRAGLSNAHLRGAHLANADLRSANLCGADLTDADLDGANLTDVVYDDKTMWPSGFPRPPSRPTPC